MNYMSDTGSAHGNESAFAFSGSWKEFLPIALTNLLLTIVTLGIYRFWAKARERRYLWSRTRFIDENLEWTGTGKEMFLGFLIVLGLVVVLYPIIALGIMGLVMSGMIVLAGVLIVAIYAGLIFLIHAAVFRSLRYQLSRTYWRGIRGGSDDSGWGYALSGLGKTILAVITLGLLGPWVMTRLWNQRWSKMSFGSHQFEANMGAGGLFVRWLLIYIVPILGAAILFFLYSEEIATEAAGQTGVSDGLVMALVFGTLLATQILSLSFYALFYREAVAKTSAAGLNFKFTARTKDWLLLFLGNLGLIIVTLGVAALFLRYRNWAFFIRHMEAKGTVAVDQLLQSSTRAPSDAEALSDAFDIGAI